MLRSIIVAILVVTAQLVATGQARAESPDCQGHWVWSYTLDRPQGSWSEDGHFYIVRGKIDGTVVFTPPFVGFIMTATAPIYEGQARLRFFNIFAFSDGVVVGTRFLNPAQDTVFQVTDDFVGTKREADAYAARETIEVTWDAVDQWVELHRWPVLSFCSFDTLRVGTWERQWGLAYQP